MSTFNGIIKEIEGLSVDRFDGHNLDSRVFFLSHCHSDHMQGLFELHKHLKKSKSIYLYTSEISELLLKQKYPKLKNFIKPLKVNRLHLISIPNKDDSESSCISVTLIPAGHCPGSVMFLFCDHNNKRILYTGDFRILPEDLSCIKTLNYNDGTPKVINKLYFDSTFWSNEYEYFPSRIDSCKYISNIIRDWIFQSKEHYVIIDVPAKIGSEYIYSEIFASIKFPVHVSQEAYDIYKRIITLNEAVTTDAEKTQIHSCKYKSEIINCQQYNENLKIRIIKPSALRWNNINITTEKIFESENENFFVCYSSHCSFYELKGFINHFKPYEVEPCVVPNNQQTEFYLSINKFCKGFLKKPCSDFSKFNYLETNSQRLKHDNENNIENAKIINDYNNIISDEFVEKSYISNKKNKFFQ